MIPYGRQSVDEDDVAAVVAVLHGDWLTQGPHIQEFERAIAARVGASHAVAFANGTAALHGACAAAELGAGDRVLTTPLSFAASANCARYVGADVGFVDVDPDTYNLDVRAVPSGCDALVAVHYAGLACDLARLSYRPRVVIEDACHALGTTTADGSVGNCAHSDMTVFSFHPVKSITTGEGGMVTTNSAALADALRRFRSHGMVARPEHGGWYYEIDELGFNYRMTDLQAALGTSQLAKLGSFVAMRNALADRYRRALERVDGVVLPPAAALGERHAYHLFPVHVPQRRQVYDAMRAAGVGVQVHYVPIHWHPVYRRLGFAPGDFPVAESVYAGLLSLPLHPTLTTSDQQYVVEVLRSAVADVLRDAVVMFTEGRLYSMRRALMPAGVVIVALVAAGCSSDAKTVTPPPSSTVATTSTTAPPTATARGGNDYTTAIAHVSLVRVSGVSAAARADVNRCVSASVVWAIGPDSLAACHIAAATIATQSGFAHFASTLDAEAAGRVADALMNAGCLRQAITRWPADAARLQRYVCAQTRLLVVADYRAYIVDTVLGHPVRANRARDRAILRAASGCGLRSSEL